MDNQEKELLYDMYINKNLSSVEIGKLENVTSSTILKRLNKYNLVQEKKDIINKKLTKEVLHELFVEKQMSIKSISELCNFSPSNIQTRLSNCNITKQMQKDYYDSLISFSPIQEDLFIGSFLGDGSFNTYSGSTNLTIFHQEKQRDYCYKKFEIVKEFCTKEDLSLSNRENEKDDPNGNRQNQYYFYTKKLRALNKYKEMSIIEALSKLNSNSLCIWMLDDGNIEWKNYKEGSGIATIGMKRFTREELDFTIEMFSKKFDLYPKIKWMKKDQGIYSGIKFSVRDTHIISNIILQSDFGHIAKETMPNKVCEYKDMNVFTGYGRVNSKTNVSGVQWKEEKQKYAVSHKGRYVGVYLDFEDAVKAKEEAQKLDPIKYI